MKITKSYLKHVIKEEVQKIQEMQNVEKPVSFVPAEKVPEYQSILIDINKIENSINSVFKESSGKFPTAEEEIRTALPSLKEKINKIFKTATA